MTYSNSDMAQQNGGSSRGKGLFYQLYGSTHSASAMTAWVWGVSRIIDALEITPSAQINTQRIGVTGCSRDGKGALMAGAFEDRIALTIPLLIIALLFIHLDHTTSPCASTLQRYSA